MLIGEIHRIPNTNELSSISKYNTIAKKLQKYKHDIIIGTDQNFDYLKIDKHKNTEEHFLIKWTSPGHNQANTYNSYNRNFNR